MFKRTVSSFRLKLNGSLGFPDSSVGHLQGRTPWFDSWVRKLCWRRDRLPTPVFLGLPCGSGCKESSCSAGDLGSISGLGRSPGEGKDYPPQYSGLENSMDCIVHGVAKSQIWLSHFHLLYKEVEIAVEFFKNVNKIMVVYMEFLKVHLMYSRDNLILWVQYHGKQ